MAELANPGDEHKHAFSDALPDEEILRARNGLVATMNQVFDHFADPSTPPNPNVARFVDPRDPGLEQLYIVRRDEAGNELSGLIIKRNPALIVPNMIHGTKAVTHEVIKATATDEPDIYETEKLEVRGNSQVHFTHARERELNTMFGYEFVPHGSSESRPASREDIIAAQTEVYFAGTEVGVDIDL